MANIGDPKRIIEVEPETRPVSPVPTPEPARKDEPAPDRRTPVTT
jgi:hypothetical protein